VLCLRPRDERACLILASIYNDTGEKAWAVPYSLQEKACAFFNANGLAKTLDEIIRIGGVEYLD
jgi:hypothetical protein